MVLKIVGLRYYSEQLWPCLMYEGFPGQEMSGDCRGKTRGWYKKEGFYGWVKFQLPRLLT
jgi:hypothetical protein